MAGRRALVRRWRAESTAALTASFVAQRRREPAEAGPLRHRLYPDHDVERDCGVIVFDRTVSRSEILSKLDAGLDCVSRRPNAGTRTHYRA
jgi:hypothetical protein